MKVLLAYALAFILGFAMLVAADLITGMPLPETVRVITQSFRIVTPVEYVLIPAAAVLPLFPAFKKLFARRPRAKKDQSSD